MPVVGELSWPLFDSWIVQTACSVCRFVFLPDALDRQLDHVVTNFQAAVDSAAQRFGLHDDEAQIMPVILPSCPVVPSAIAGLSIGNQPQRLLQHSGNSSVFGHAMSLSEHEGRQPVVVHVPLRIGDVQQP